MSFAFLLFLRAFVLFLASPVPSDYAAGSESVLLTPLTPLALSDVAWISKRFASVVFYDSLFSTPSSGV
jgi:hypothetical protein